MVPKERLELSHPRAGDFESPASTNSATSAFLKYKVNTNFTMKR